MTTMAQPRQARRRHSEMDMTSLRRVSEAMLLAQNRARVATDRANRCERVLRAVLSSVNLHGLDAGSLGRDLEMMDSFEVMPASPSSSLSFSDWDMLHVIIEEEGATAGLPATLMEHWETQSAPATSHPVLRTHGDNESIACIADEVVRALHAASRRADQRIARRRKSWVATTRQGEVTSVFQRVRLLYLWQHHHRQSVWMPAWQYVAGLVVGLVVGVTLTRELLNAQYGNPSASFLLLPSCITKRCLPQSAHQRIRAQIAAAVRRRLPVTLSVEDITYSLHYPHGHVVEVS